MIYLQVAVGYQKDFYNLENMKLDGGPRLFTFKCPENIGKALNHCKSFAAHDKKQTACKLPWSKLFIVAVGQYPLENFLVRIAHTGIGIYCYENYLL